MKKALRSIFSIMLILTLLVSCLATSVGAASKITTTPSGYTSADDVHYVKVGSYVANWGARGEIATFLSTYAESFYTGSYTYDSLIKYSGGTSQSNAPSSALYSQLKNLMQSKHTHQTSYDETKNLYKYTDCVLSDYSQLSSFYSGAMVTGNWTTGGTAWNREHTWPNSKGLDGNDENDIMMLRPTVQSENSSRGNTAYGESGSYFDPGESTRGDVARIVLYVYVRWGNTGKMWGTSGVMESLDVLLDWMEEDPVDTWEMGRNDAVQSITGTRNVFVDYPELAWLLFGEDVPADMTTPSGKAADGPDSGSGDVSCGHTSTEIRNYVAATCGENGYTGDTYCTACGKKVLSGSSIYATNNHSYGVADANGLKTCSVCGKTTSAGNVPDVDPSTCTHESTILMDEAVSCTEMGYSGDTYCSTCHTLLMKGTVTFPVGHDWRDMTDKLQSCTRCNEGRRTPTEGNGGATVAIVGGSVGGVSVIAVVLFFILRRRPI